MVSQGRAIGLFLIAVALTIGGGDAVTYGAATFGFTAASASTATDAAIGEDQFFMDVLDESARQVLFRIRNEGPTASSITTIVFDEQGGLLSPLFDSVTPQNVAGSGVSFGQPTLPPDLIIPAIFGVFTVAPEFAITANSPELVNGVNPGESLNVQVTLTDDIVTSDLMNRLEAGTVRVALEAQGFPDGGTATFLNNTSPVVTPVPPPAVIPAPGALLLGALGAGWVGWMRRQRTLV